MQSSQRKEAKQSEVRVVLRLAAHIFSSWYIVACIEVVFLYCAYILTL